MTGHTGPTRRFALAVGAGGALTAASAGAGARAEIPGAEGGFLEAVDALRLAMVKGDAKALNRLLHERLIYMHSSGHAQTKQNLLSDLAGKTFFASLSYTEQTFNVIDLTGVAAITVDQVKNLPGGRTRASRIKVMQTWIRSDREWKLLARLSSILSSPLAPACGERATVGGRNPGVQAP